MIRGLFFDLDGTLLNGQKCLSPANAAALQACRAKGLQLFLATARPPLLERMLGWEPAVLQLFDGGVYCNGACIQLERQTRYIHLPPSVVDACMDAAAAYPGLNIALQMEQGRHAFRYPLADFAYAPWGLEPPDVVPIGKDCAGHTIKILLFYENLVDSVTPLPPSLASSLEALCRPHAQFYWTDQGKVIQMTGRQASKYHAIEWIRQQRHWQPDEIAVFGDDQNDVPMLAAYENSVAMADGCKAARQAARFVTRSHEEDGVAYGLSQLLHLL